MPGEWTGLYRKAIDNPREGSIPLIFLTAAHARLSVPIRVVSDGSMPGGRVAEFIRGADVWLGMPFDFVLPSDDDRDPRARLEVINADRRIGMTLDYLETSPRITMEVFSSLDFVRQSPPNAHQWVATTDAVSRLTVSHLRLRNTQVDHLTASAELGSWELNTEPYPAVRATQDIFPALFK